MTDPHATHDVGQLDDVGVDANGIVRTATAYDPKRCASERGQTKAFGLSCEIGCALGSFFEATGVLAVLDRVDALA